MQKIVFILSLFILNSTSIKAQSVDQKAEHKKFFVGSTLFMLGNFSSKNKPDFAQLNFGYRFTKKDAISIEVKTWKYAWSLGIPYGKFYQAPSEEFPGYVREVGFALSYQRFLWKRLYAAVHVMNARQWFVDKQSSTIANGFQIFNTYRIGYQFTFFKNRFFIEPSIALTHRPYHTKMPKSFKQLDDKWGKLFWGEPGLHFGVNF